MDAVSSQWSVASDGLAVLSFSEHPTPTANFERLRWEEWDEGDLGDENVLARAQVEI